MKTKLSIALMGIVCLFLLVRVEQEAKTPEFNPGKKFTVKELKEDFHLMQTALEEGHGGLYRYTSKQELGQQFDTIFSQLTQPLTAREFLLHLAPLIANINDGHTRLMLPTPHADYLKKQPIIFPFKLKFINKKAYLFRNYSEHTNLVMGGEVISINSQPISTIIEKMLPIISSDGHIESSKYRRLESTGYFGNIYSILFGKTTEYSFVYHLPGKKDEKTIKCKGIPNIGNFPK